MKDIFSIIYASPSLYNKKVIFDIVKDDKNEQTTYEDKILNNKIIGLEIDEWLKSHGCKAIFNRIERRNEK